MIRAVDRDIGSQLAVVPHFDIPVKKIVIAKGSSIPQLYFTGKITSVGYDIPASKLYLLQATGKSRQLNLFPIVRGVQNIIKYFFDKSTDGIWLLLVCSSNLYNLQQL